MLEIEAQEILEEKKEVEEWVNVFYEWIKEYKDGESRQI